MGGLKKLKFPEQVVKTPGGDLTVRGLSLTAITQLAIRNREALKSLFEKAVEAQGSDVQLDNMEAVATTIAEQAPGLVAEVIAIACGETDAEAIEAAAGLPFPSQVELLEAIGRLTFSTEGGVKKLVATVIGMTSGTTKALNEALTSTSGSGV